LLGVCAGLARRATVDTALIRAVFLLGTAIGGIGIAAYIVAAVSLEDPAEDDPVPPRKGRRLQALGIAVLAAAIATGIALEGALIDPGNLLAVSLLLGGVGLVWRRTGGEVPTLGAVDSGRVVRIVAGLGLVLAGILLFTGTGTDVSGATAAAIAAGIVAAGAGLIFAPRLAETRQALDEARRARIRAEEREAMAARVHDSVLQTLAMIQREEGRGAAALARRQERELREVLYGGTAVEGETLAGAIAEAAARVEALHRIRVDLVCPRDLALTEATRALVDAAGEAMTNAAKHAGVASVSVMVRVDPQQVSVFVRDRGVGFDPGQPDGSGRGLQDSIRSRVSRAGGSVAIESVPGEGTEVVLSVPFGKDR
jgi:signal transduction histidine kinase